MPVSGTEHEHVVTHDGESVVLGYLDLSAERIRWRKAGFIEQRPLEHIQLHPKHGFSPCLGFFLGTVLPGADKVLIAGVPGTPLDVWAGEDQVGIFGHEDSGLCLRPP